MIRKIVRQSSYLIFAQVFVKGISFFYSLFLANSIGVANFGLYTVALSYFSIISSISDFGISRYLIREIAKDREAGSKILLNVILLRTISVLVIFFIFAALLYLLDSNTSRVDLTLIAILAVVPQSIALTMDGLFVAVQKISLSAIGTVILNIFTVILGVLFISFGLNSFGAVLAIVFGQVCYAIFMLALSSTLKENFLKASDSVNFTLIRRIVTGSLPYGVLGVIGIVSFKVDTLILSYFRGNFETGIYGAGYKFLEATTFIPGALATVLFPLVAKMYLFDAQKIKGVYFKSLAVMLVLGILVAAGFIFVLPHIILWFLPKYNFSIQVVQILAIAIPFIFLHVPSAQILLSTDKYFKKLILIYLGLFAFNLILYFSLIPKYGYLGASWSTVVSEALTFGVFFSFINFRVFGQYNK